jgi:hypothetical protein
MELSPSYSGTTQIRSQRDTFRPEFFCPRYGLAGTGALRLDRWLGRKAKRILACVMDRRVRECYAGRATVATLRINLDHRVAQRQMLIAEGVFGQPNLNGSGSTEAPPLGAEAT